MLAGFNAQHSTQVYEDWHTQADGSHFNTDLTRPTNDTLEGFAALSQHVRHGLVSEAMPPEGVDSGIPNLYSFCAGRVAIQQLWPGDIANCEVNVPDVLEDIMVGEPFGGPEKQGLLLFVDKYMVCRLTRDPDACFAALEWLSRVDVNKAINVEWRRAMPAGRRRSRWISTRSHRGGSSWPIGPSGCDGRSWRTTLMCSRRWGGGWRRRPWMRFR